MTQESQDNLQNLFDALDDFLFILDVDGRILNVNPVVEQRLGYSLEELKGNDVLVLHPPERHEEARKIIADMAKRKASSCSVPLMAKDGTLIPVETRVTRGTWSNQDVLFGMSRDVTEHKEAEQELQRQKAFFEQLFENSPDAILLVDDEDKTIAVNKSFERNFQYSMEEIRGRSANDFIIPTHLLDEALDLTDHALQGNVVRKESVRKRKDGSLIDVEILGYPITQDRKMMGTYVIYKDISARKQAEKAQRESEDRYRSFIEGSGTGVCLIQDDRFCFVNKRLCEITGFSEKELLERSFLDLLHPDDQKLLQEQAAKRLSGAARLEHNHYRGIKKDGSIIWVELWGTLIEFEGQPAILANIIDITERKLAEQALRESEEKYRLNFENVSDVIYSVDLEFRVTDVSPSVEALLGYTPEEVIGRTFDEVKLLAPKYRELAFSNALRLLQGKRNPPTEYEFIAKDGTRKIGEVISSPLIRENKIVGVLSVARDITDRKHAEHALEESEKRYRMVVDNALTGIYIRSEDGIEFGNRRLLEMLGYSMEELRKRTLLDFIHPEDKDRARERAVQRMAGKERTGDSEFRVIKKNGDIIWVDVLGRKIEFEGKPAVLTHIYDITERKKMREELRKREEQYRLLFETVGDVVWIMDKEFRMLSVSPSVEGFLGYTPGEMIGRKLGDMQTLVPEYYAIAFENTSKILAGENVAPAEYEFVAKDGTRKLAEVRGAPIFEDGEAVAIIAVSRDITQHRRLEQQLFQAQKMESIGTLAGGIAHDFNNILGGILGYASLMKTKTTENHPFFDYIDTIEKGAIRASELTAQLLAFARGGKYDVKSVNLNRVVGETLRIIGETFDKSISIETVLLDELPTVEADEGQMQQALMNLCINAADAMPQGGTLRLETCVEDSLDHSTRIEREIASRPWVVVSVSDTGNGMDKETVQRIFEPFYTTKEQGKGTGLGLSMVYGVVKNHGGQVNVCSEPGKGSTFSIYLPVSGKPEEDGAPANEMLQRGEELILVVDDEEHIRSLAKEILENFGYRVLLAEGGEEAIKIFGEKREEIALVILDMIMPRMGGRETFARLKELNPRIKAVLSTGYSRDGKAQEMLDEGMMGYIQKPYQVDALLSKVRSTLDAET